MLLHLQDLHALKLSGAADWAKSEARRKSVAKAAKKAAKAKKAPKRMISEIDAQTASKSLSHNVSWCDDG